MAKDNKWIFLKTTNKDMENFIGRHVDLYTPRRRDDGRMVLYAAKPGNRDMWYFYTSTIEAINKDIDLNDGIARLEVRTRNSKYVFVKNIPGN